MKTVINLLDTRVWAGTEHSLLALAQRLRADPPLPLMHRADASGDPGEGEGPQDAPELPRLAGKAGSIGIVSISGSLINSDDPFWNSWLGMTGYGEIRAAVLALAADPGVSTIVLDIDSGGGTTSGMDDAASCIAAIDRQVKPIYAYTGGACCSAAYYLACTARRFAVSPLAVTGSIGVLAVHQSIARMLTTDGVDVSIIRAGEFKALANPFEPLSDKARAQVQAQVDASYQVFLEHVAQCRQKSVSAVQTGMADGREFIGRAAVDIGLADAVQGFDAFIESVRFAVSPEMRQPASHVNQQGGPMPPEHDQPQNPAQASSQAGAPSAAQGGNPPADTGAQIHALQARVDVLTGQLASAQTDLVAERVKTQTLDEQINRQAGTTQALRQIAEAAVAQLSVALGGSAPVMSGWGDSQIVAEHTRLAAQFASRFPALIFTHKFRVADQLEGRWRLPWLIAVNAAVANGYPGEPR